MRPLNFIDSTSSLSYASKRAQYLWCLLSLCLFAITISILLYLQVYFIVQAYTLKQRHRALTSALAAIPDLYSKTEELTRHCQELEQAVAQIQASSLPHTFMSRIAELLPYECCLDDFIYVQNQIQLQGRALHSQALSRFTTSLSQHFLSTQVTLTSAQKRDTYLTFSITIHL